MVLRAVAQCAGGSSITLQTNGAANASQSILNLVNGSNISITDGGGGAISIASTAASTWDTIGNAAGSKTTSNGDNAIVYQTAQTTASRISWRITESAAGSSTGTPVLFQVDTIAASTAIPMLVMSRASEVFRVSPTAAQVLGASGSNTNPTWSFSSFTSTGMYGGAGPALRFTVNGTDRVTFDTSQMQGYTGSGATPAITDRAAGNSGIFFGNNFSGIGTAGSETVRWLGASNAKQSLHGGCTFANLGTPANGSFAYCSDCDPALVDQACTSAGAKTGAFAFRINGAWLCIS